DLAWHVGADPARVAVIPCGVDTELFRPGDATASRGRLQIAGDRVLLFVGRLTPIKGLETLLRALALLAAEGTAGRDVRLVVVGGPRGAHEGAGAPAARRGASRRGGHRRSRRAAGRGGR